MPRVEVERRKTGRCHRLAPSVALLMLLALPALTGCVGFGLGSFKPVTRTETTYSRRGPNGETAPSGYGYASTGEHQYSGNWGVDIGYKLGPTWSNVPAHGWSVAKGLELHLDIRVFQFMLTVGYAAEGGATDTASLRYDGWYAQLTYFQPIFIPLLFVTFGVAVQSGTVAWVPGANIREIDSDANAVRGLLGVAFLLPTASSGSLWPDFLVRLEARYTKTADINLGAMGPTTFDGIGGTFEIMILW